MLNLENSFFGLPKHYKRGVSANFCVFVVEREEKGNKIMITVSGFGFLSKKWPFRDEKTVFQKMGLLKPRFL